jgi:hypothetical protein
MRIKFLSVREPLAASVLNTTKMFLTFATFALVAMTIWFQHRYLLAVPAGDDVFDRLKFYDAGSSLRRLAMYFLSAHNEHRITTTRLLSILDEIIFHGKEYVQVFCSNLFQITSAVVCFIAIFRDKTKTMLLTERLFLFSPLLLLFLNPSYFYTLFFPFQVQHAIMALLCVLAAERISAASSLKEGPRINDRQIWLPLLGLAIVASFTLGNGPFILLAAAACSVIFRWRLRITVILIVLALTQLTIVLLTTTSVGSGSNNISQILRFSAMYWGSPFMRYAPWPGGYETYSNAPHLAMVIGMAVFGVGVFFGLWRLIRPGFGGPTAAFGLVILMIVIATGLAAGHSRVQFGIMEAGNKKYASFAALGWVGVLAVFTGVSWEFFPHWRTVSGWFYMAVLVLLLPISATAYNRETHIWQKFSERNWEAAIAAVYKINMRDPLFNISHTPAEIASYVRYAEMANSGAFAQFRYKWGDDAPTIFSQMSDVHCRGSAQDVTVIPVVDRENVFDVPGTPAMIRGWSWMDQDFSPAQTVLAVDSTNKVVGLARTTRTSEIAEEWLGQKFGQNVGWYGFARSSDLSSLRFYAISADDKSYCSLGTVGVTR